MPTYYRRVLRRALRDTLAFAHGQGLIVGGATIVLSFIGSSVAGGEVSGDSVLWSLAGFGGVSLLALMVNVGLAPVRLDRELASQVPADPAVPVEVTFAWRGRILDVGIKNDGPSLQAASMNLLVPDRDGLCPYLANEGGHIVKQGSIQTTAEELEPGVSSVYWEGSRLFIAGFHTSNIWRFMVTQVEGPTPVKFKLGADELGGWHEWPYLLEPPESPLLLRLKPESSG